MKYCTFILILAATLISGRLRAQVPKLVNYQGRVAVNGVNFDGTGQFKFALVSTNGSVTYWSNNGTSNGGSEPSAAVPLAVTQGLYSLLLGDTALGANMTTIPSTVFTNPDVRLRVWFNDGVHGSQLLIPDQRLAPATYLADGAVTSASVGAAAITSGKIAAGAVTGTNIVPSSLDYGTFLVQNPPSNGKVLGYNNGSLTWTAPGAADGLWTPTGADIYRSTGVVGIGTTSPQAGYRLDVVGNTRLAPGGSGGALQFGTPNFETGMTIFGTNRADVRFDGSTLKLVAGAGTGVPSSFNGITINTAGAVGMGTATPLAGYRLDVLGNTRVVPQSGGGEIYCGSPNGETGMTIKGSNRADVRFDDFSLKLLAATGVGAPPSANGIVINTAGSVGIGTATPQTKLHLYAPDSVTDLIETGGQDNAWTQLKFRNGAGGWITGTSRNFHNNEFYFAREDATTNAFAIATNGDAFLQGTLSCKVLSIRGADVAEPFDIAEQDLPKGTVVVIDPQRRGGVKRSTKAYDRRVAGIVSGANGINSGIILSQPGVNEGGQNVAISGRVYVQADATNDPIEPGDMLTTSDTRGYAMKVSNHARAQGAVIGKAMSALDEGKGMVLVLVTLQ